MKKKELQYQKWVRKMYDKYAPILFIEKYHLKVTRTTEFKYLASKFNYPYLDLEILYTDDPIKDWEKDKKDAERRIIHEFCHAITDPFYNTIIQWPTKTAIEDARERLNDHIAQIVNKHFNLL